MTSNNDEAVTVTLFHFDVRTESHDHICNIGFATSVPLHNLTALNELLLPRVRGFWSWFGCVCSLIYCNGNFRVTMVSEPFNVIL